jgi:8-oxo-dGTP diphosphatase
VAALIRRPRVGVGLVVRRGGDLLLVRRSGDHGVGTWSTPGGYLEFGEQPADCAVRETVEETQVKVGEPRFLAVTNDVFGDEGRHSLTLWFEADHVAGEPSPEPSEIAEVGWFSEDELPQPLFAPLRRLLAGQTIR